MTTAMFALAVALAGPVAAHAAGGEKVVTVSGKSMPWDASANRKFDYGRSGGRAPTVVFDLLLIPNSTLKFSATGSTTTAVGGGSFGPEGQVDYITNNNRGNSGANFPSAYVDPATYPVNLNELIGAFVTADGIIVGRPFAIGKGTAVKVPHGAAAVSLGLNDDIFSDNTGTLTVTISYPKATVTGEEVQ